MALLGDWEGSLQPCKIVDGQITVRLPSGNLIDMEVYVSATGHLFAKPIAPPPIDQLGEKEPRSQGSRRWQGSVDQI